MGLQLLAMTMFGIACATDSHNATCKCHTCIYMTIRNLPAMIGGLDMPKASQGGVGKLPPKYCLISSWALSGSGATSLSFCLLGFCPVHCIPQQRCAPKVDRLCIGEIITTCSL